MQINANGIAIEIDDQGPPAAQPVLLVMGLGMQLTSWPQVLVQALRAAGFRVLRMDNRDAGLSQGFDDLGVPNLLLAGLKHLSYWPLRPPYSLTDMAGDALGVLDALGLPAAHVVGASLGGMVAQHLAAAHPERVRSLTLMMTSAGARELPNPTPQAWRALLARPATDDPVAVAEYMLEVTRAVGSADDFDATALRQRFTADARRAWRPAGVARQIVAVMADADRTPLLANITAPTHIIHGQADPLVPQAAAHHLAKHIRGATLDIVPGMGHDFPDALMPRVAQGIAANAQRSLM